MKRKLKKALLIVNTGTPQSYKRKDVRQFIGQYLTDKRVLTMPKILRYGLVYGIILPRRTKKSQKRYQKYFQNQESPLKKHLEDLIVKLQQKAKGQIAVYGAFSYGCTPKLTSVLTTLEKEDYDEVIILPLFPQYASATVGSVSETVLKRMADWNHIPSIQLVTNFYQNEKYQILLAEHLRAYQPENYEKIIFSYHGLPLNHLLTKTEDEECKRYCYCQACYQTTKFLASKLQLNQEIIITSFQSRLSEKWISPFTDQVVKKLAKQGIKKILVVSPSFVADCLESEYELGVELKDEFLAAGGEKFELVSSFNSADAWVDFILETICKNKEA